MVEISTCLSIIMKVVWTPRETVLGMCRSLETTILGLLYYRISGKIKIWLALGEDKGSSEDLKEEERSGKAL